MSHGAADRYAWTEPGVEDLGGGVYRIPLPLPLDGLRAVNVYAIADPGGVDLIDAGMAIVAARESLAAGLKHIGYGFGDIRNFFVTHSHIDHYSMAVELRRTFGTVVSLGEQERANLAATRDLVKGSREGHAVFSAANMRRFGAWELYAELIKLTGPDPAISNWDDPDRWLADGAALDLRTRTLRAVHTPGHTRGHLIYTDAAAGITFAGDHVLPHITPSIGFEPAATPLALADYLDSLARTLALPDARLLPAHGPVTASVHERVSELLAHHDRRLAEMHQAVLAGHATAYEVAKAIKWTRRQRLFDELDLFSRVMSVNETAAHLEVLSARGLVTRQTGADGVEIYQAAGVAHVTGS
jgi:glyoxylase-like metal-dependent hydrolase (beta-lactamase superfamily II)